MPHLAVELGLLCDRKLLEDSEIPDFTLAFVWMRVSDGDAAVCEPDLPVVESVPAELELLTGVKLPAVNELVEDPDLNVFFSVREPLTAGCVELPNGHEPLAAAVFIASELLLGVEGLLVVTALLSGVDPPTDNEPLFSSEVLVNPEMLPAAKLLDGDVLLVDCELPSGSELVASDEPVRGWELLVGEE